MSRCDLRSIVDSPILLYPMGTIIYYCYCTTVLLPVIGQKTGSTYSTVYFSDRPPCVSPGPNIPGAARARAALAEAGREITP